MKVITLFFEHITTWGLVWFGLIFWGSIFNAIFHYFLGDNHSLAFALTAYLLGLILGLLGKYKGWSWIN